MAEQESAPIIVKKKKAGHGGHHGGAWKVAYADFVTAMMALFIVLWLLSSSEQVKKAVGGYFQDPTGSGKLMGSTLAGVGEGILVSEDNMDRLKETIEDAMKEVPEIQQIRSQIQITVTGEGLRIEMIESEKGTFFESGSPVPTGSARDLLGMLAAQLGKLPNRILIEGHTDSKPFTGGADYGNWELSVDRANAARRLMQSAGIRTDQIGQVRGFADQNLRNADHPEAASNRRVSVIVQYRTPPGKAGSPVDAKPVGGHDSESEEKEAAKAASSHGGVPKPGTASH